MPYLENIVLHSRNSGSVENDGKQSNTAESGGLDATIATRVNFIHPEEAKQPDRDRTQETRDQSRSCPLVCNEIMQPEPQGYYRCHCRPSMPRFRRRQPGPFFSNSENKGCLHWQSRPGSQASVLRLEAVPDSPPLALYSARRR